MMLYFAVTTYQPTRSSHGQPTPPSSTATWWPDPSHHSSAPTPLLPWLASSRTQRSATGTWWRSATSFWCPSPLALRRQSRSPRSPGKFTCQNIYKKFIVYITVSSQQTRSRIPHDPYNCSGKEPLFTHSSRPAWLPLTPFLMSPTSPATALSSLSHPLLHTDLPDRSQVK